VAGADSSTQACKVVFRDAESGRLVRERWAPHPQGTEVDPAAWEAALRTAVAEAGGLEGIAAIAVGGQQHGMVCLDEHGEVVRPALLWNDTRSAGAAGDLIEELGGGEAGRGPGPTRSGSCRSRRSRSRSFAGWRSMSRTTPLGPPLCACRTTG
jgi:xylulokinase